METNSWLFRSTNIMQMTFAKFSQKQPKSKKAFFLEIVPLCDVAGGPDPSARGCACHKQRANCAVFRSPERFSGIINRARPLGRSGIQRNDESDSLKPIKMLLICCLRSRGGARYSLPAAAPAAALGPLDFVLPLNWNFLVIKSGRRPGCPDKAAAAGSWFISTLMTRFEQATQIHLKTKHHFILLAGAPHQPF